MTFIITWILINVLAFFKRNSKMIFCIQMFFIFLLLGWNYGSLDYQGNEVIFLSQGKLGYIGIKYGWLHAIIAKFCISRGYSFTIFNIICAFIIVAPLTYVTLKSTKMPCIVALLFSIYPLMDTVIQKRFGPGMALVILGLYFLQKDKAALFITCVTLAIGFHFSFVFFYLVLVWVKIDVRIQKRFLAIFIILETAILFGAKRFLGTFISISKLNRYLYSTSYSSKAIGLLYVIAMLGYIILFWIVRKTDEYYEQKESNQFISSLNKMMFFLVPLLYMESVYLRYYRIVLFFIFIYLANHLETALLLKDRKVMIDKRYSPHFLFIFYFIVLNISIYLTSKVGLSGYWKNMLDNYCVHFF